jgi:hypothetical protein
VAHSVPLVAMITLTFAELGGARATLWRVLGLLAATTIGIALTGSEHVLSRDGGSWINAAVAGLLFHILLHDADDREVPARARPLEAAGVLIGAVLPLVADHDHDATGLGAALPVALASAAAVVGAVALVAIVIVRAFLDEGVRAPILARLTGPFVPLAVVVAAYLLAGARGDDDAVWTPAAIGVPPAIGLAAAAAVGAAILVGIGRVGFIAWLGSAHAHDGDDDEHAEHAHALGTAADGEPLGTGGDATDGPHRSHRHP